MPPTLWVYRARLDRLVDADTIDLEVDAGFRGYRRERLRLLGVDAPEVRGPTRDTGLAASGFAALWLAEAGADPAYVEWPLRVQTSKADSFGRYLCLCWRVSDGHELGADLVAAGHAVAVG